MRELSKKMRNVLAVIIASLPGVALLVWYRNLDRTSVAVSDMLIYPLVFGTGLIILILLLNRYLCFASIGSFNHGKGTFLRDISLGLLLFVAFVALAVVELFTVMRWFPGEGPPPEFQELIEELSRNPLLLVIWLGPVVWIGVGLFEELYRVFFLKSLWEIWDTPGSKWTIISISAALTGAVHSYQGVSGVISTGIMGLVAAIFYLKYRRLLPLVIAHALYDSAWIVFGVLMSRNQ